MIFQANFIYTILSVTVVSLLSLVGLALFPMGKENLHKTVFALVSLAVGGLLGDAFIHLLPDAYGTLGRALTTPLLVLVGFFLFFVLEHLLHWRHEHSVEESSIHPYGYMNLMADALHNFIDGLLIGASYQVNPRMGIATTMAVLLHEIPHEAGNFGILLHSGFSKNRALFFNFLSALTAIAGGVCAWSLGTISSGLDSYMIPFTAGGFIYIAGADLIPQLHLKTGLKQVGLQLVSISIGIGIMVLLKIAE
jgi:zinc and cadmium transporter